MGLDVDQRDLRVAGQAQRAGVAKVMQHQVAPQPGVDAQQHRPQRLVAKRPDRSPPRHPQRRGQRTSWLLGQVAGQPQVERRRGRHPLRLAGAFAQQPDPLTAPVHILTGHAQQLGGAAALETSRLTIARSRLLVSAANTRSYSSSDSARGRRCGAFCR